MDREGHAAASTGARPARPGRWRRLFGSTGKPPQWRLVICAVVCGAIAAMAGLLIDPAQGAVLAGVTAALVGAVGSSGAPRVGVFEALVAAPAIFVAFLASGRPLVAAAAMALVAVLTSVASVTGLGGAVLGVLGSLGYVLTAIVSASAHLARDVPPWSAALRILIGAVVGLTAVAADAALRGRRSAAPRRAPSTPPPWRLIWTSLRTLDRRTRDGLRRAVPLAIGMYLFQRDPSHDALWVFPAVFVVLLPSARQPVAVAAVRVASTIGAVVLVWLLSLLLPDQVLFAAAIIFVLAGIAYQPVNRLWSGACTAIGAILLAGAPDGTIGDFAQHRLVDTAIGCALALLAMYLLWPHDHPDRPA